MIYDFCGYATRSNVKCSDGRTIMPDAFRDDDGKKVPLVWNHQHNSPDNVLGHAILENRPDGVYAYATFNDNEVGQRAKELVRHGDIAALSIYANKLKETAGKVMHGVIREVSLVLAGANPEALIDSFVAHSDGNVVEDREQGQFYSGMEGELYHAAEEDEEEAEDKETKAEDSETEDAEKEERQKRMERMLELRKQAQERLKNAASDENEEEADKASDDSDEEADTADNENDEEEDGDEKVKHADSDESDEENAAENVLDTLTDKQKAVVMALLQSAIDEANKDDTTDDASSEAEEEDDGVAHADSEDEKVNGKTIGDILDTFTDEQKVVVMALLEEALENAAKTKNDRDEENEEEPKMKHNVFDKETSNENVLSHSDEMKILEMAKDSSIGTLKGAMKAFCDNEELAHGFDSQSLSILFPEYQDVKPGAPEMLTTDQGWITKVLNKVHKIPMTKVRVRFSDIRNIENLRAKGYNDKTAQKAINGDISALYRVADAQTVYVRSDLSRDDILDMTDFDYVAYMYGVDKMLLNEELATAIMLGDGRAVSDQYKIKEDRIIPIWTDDELFTIHATVDFDAAKTKLQGTNTNTYFGENFIYAEAFVETLMNARVDAKNSALADLYIAPKALNKMLLARDRNGRRIYNTLEELRSAMNVREIITAEQFEGKTRTVTVDGTSTEMELLGIFTKLENYDLGANKGGEITHFTDFDLDFNKEKSLLETRVSGMQVRPLASVVLEAPVVPEVVEP